MHTWTLLPNPPKANNKETKMITISKKEYEDMQDSLLWLQALEDAGVDNWGGCEFAQEIYRDYKGEEEEEEDAE